ncbi:MAG: LysR family transcriptional regulator [Candidatus Thiodiazotropha sp. (ex Dulcina madagascariensis)]|nr:LysR family transcriptional regulator [Candidatus Thiodiazotropha sp. (ex Dulcina madagascariensis)]
MTLTELRYMIAVYQARNFGRAARACFVSQPTLSLAIKKLEEELDVQLFERRANAVTITPIGKRIVEQAQYALEAAEGIKLIARQGQDQLAGPVRTGAIHTIGPYLFPNLIPRLRENALQMPLIIEENYTAVLSEKLKRGELDVIIIALPFNEQGLVTLPLYEEPFVVLLPSEHSLNTHTAIEPDMLEEENVLLLGAGHCFRDHVLEACPACQPKPGPDGEFEYTIEGTSLETIRHMVVSGLGISILPCTAGESISYSKERLLSIRRFTDPAPRRTVALAWRVSYPRPKVIDVINRSIHECDLASVIFCSRACKGQSLSSDKQQSD